MRSHACQERKEKDGTQQVKEKKEKAQKLSVDAVQKLVAETFDIEGWVTAGIQKAHEMRPAFEVVCRGKGATIETGKKDGDVSQYAIMLEV